MIEHLGYVTLYINQRDLVQGYTDIPILFPFATSSETVDRS